MLFLGWSGGALLGLVVWRVVVEIEALSQWSLILKMWMFVNLHLRCVGQSDVWIVCSLELKCKSDFWSVSSKGVVLTACGAIEARQQGKWAKRLT